MLPFGNRTVILTLTGAQLREALLNGFSPVCNSAIATGRFPQVSGLKLTFHCSGTTPVIDAGLARAGGPGRPADADRPGRHGPHRHQRLHVHGWRRLHGAGGRHRRAPAGRRPARGDDRVHRRELAGGAGGRGPDNEGAGGLACAHAYEDATERLVEEAEGKRATAVIAFRFDTSELGSTWTEICACGTAVKVSRAG